MAAGTLQPITPLTTVSFAGNVPGASDGTYTNEPPRRRHDDWSVTLRAMQSVAARRASPGRVAARSCEEAQCAHVSAQLFRVTQARSAAAAAAAASPPAASRAPMYEDPATPCS